MFGLPYITCPSEAEAQCAYLDQTNQTDGSITEDSDVWLFGGKRVYKNFFGTDQFIEAYTNDVIANQLGLDRDALINIAYLVGSDYTQGIENVGIVKAVEILKEFDGDGLDKLRNFKWVRIILFFSLLLLAVKIEITNIAKSRKWHTEAKENSKLSKLRAQLARLELPDEFPNVQVYRAYMEPDVDKSREEFSWSLPDLDLIRK